MNIGIGVGIGLRRGVLLSPELLVNGDFADGATGWTVSGTDATHVLTFSGGTVRYQSGATSPILSLGQPGIVTLGATYRVVMVVSAWVSGGLKLDQVSGGPLDFAGVGSITKNWVANGTGIAFVRNSVNVDMTIDSISLRRVVAA